MERKDKKKKEESNKIWFRKLGGGIFRLPSGRIIKPNQRFQEHPGNIPEAFMDTIIPEDAEKAKALKETGVATAKSAKYEVKEVATGWYDVVDENDKVINEKRLRQGAAEALKQALEK